MGAKGTSVQFSVVQGIKGPEAEGIRPLGGAPIYGNNASANAPMRQSMAPPIAAPPQFQPVYKMPMRPPPGSTMQGPTQFLAPAQFAASVVPQQNQLGNQVFFGTIKSYNAEKGWGHIECMQTQAVYGKDMFVLKSALQDCPEVAPGDYVAFSVTMGKKGPEATSVRSAGQGGMDTVYAGTIKQFTEEKGYGFISCQETRDIFGKDIFIHRNVLDGYVPVVGETVHFGLQISKEGRPEATQMQFNQAGVSDGYGATNNGYGATTFGGAPRAPLLVPQVRAHPYQF